MKKFVFSAVAATALLATAVAASAVSFDINEPLSTDGPLVAPWVVSGTVTPAIVDGALLLTNATTGQRGFALYDQAISVTRGIDVTFSQSQWGGDGADGIVFFVKNGNDTGTTPGGAGGSMGYAPTTDSDGDSGNGLTPGNGLSGALIGIGLDSVGNFDGVETDGTDCSTTFVRGGGNAIVVRGPGQGLLGYCLLADAFDLDANSLRTLSYNGGSNRVGQTRVVRVVIDPSTDADPRVTMYYDGGTEPIIDIALPAEFSEVSTVKIGFSAGTGGQVNNHSVWGLTSTAAPTTEEEELAPTGSSEAVGLGALIVATLAGIAAVAVRRRRTQQ
jgi:hypothetical protein